MKRTAIATLLAVTSLVPASARAEIDPGYPAFSVNSFPGNGWVAERFHVEPETRFSLEAITKLKDSRRSATGYWLLDANDKLLFGLQFFGPTAAAVERHVEVGAAGIVADERYGGSFGNGGMTANWRFLQGGEYTVVAVAIADGSIGSELNLYAEAGLTPLAKTTGSRSFVRSDADFRGAANVVWSEGCLPPYPYWLVCSGVAAQANVATSVDVEDRLFGIFSTGSNVARKSWTGPGGTGGESTGGGAFGWANGEPGTYGFQVAANVGAAYFNGITAWGADVRLPD